MIQALPFMGLAVCGTCLLWGTPYVGIAIHEARGVGEALPFVWRSHSMQHRHVRGSAECVAMP